jgi:hypothetical protein
MQYRAEFDNQISGPIIIQGNGDKASDIEALLRALAPRIGDEVIRRISLELGGGLAA